MKLRDLFDRVDLREPLPAPDHGVAGIAYDSRRVESGGAFFAIRGEKTDGNLFVDRAIAQGAAVIASEAPRPAQLAPATRWVRVVDARKALATAAANFYGRPAESVRLIGVTGTNGKTTTSFLMDSILRAAGNGTGLFGTILYRTPRAERPATTTTPESLELQQFLSEVRDAGGAYAVLEASSHALVLDRLWGCRFDAAVFTNLTRDHLDFHKTFEEYFAAKRRLFENTGAGAPAAGIINADDPYAARLNGLARQTLSYGLGNGAQVTTKKFALAFSGLDFSIESPAGRIRAQSKLVGRINVYNILAAAAAAVALGIPAKHIEEGIARLEAVPGRFERIDLGQPYLLVVDYAHTDDALRNLIATAKELNSGARIITLFGCGGDRDRTKRPLMGEVAGRGSAVVVLSSDNPRSEDPVRIINDALVGLQRTQARTIIEPDREAAIERALDEAKPGDIVLLAGKGHETYQVLRDRTIDFDDREMARRSLRRRGFGN